jgi:hypothetical protein
MANGEERAVEPESLEGQQVPEDLEGMEAVQVSTPSADPIRFGAEFGPYRSSKSSGVSLSTFRTLVWTSNIGGLLLVAIGLELLITRNAFGWALACFIAGVAVALFPSNYEIVGMDQGPSAATASPSDEELIG